MGLEYDERLPILLKYQTNPSKALIQELCSLKLIWTREGYLWAESLLHVERNDYFDRTYIQCYGSYGNVSEAKAMQADRVHVANYAGKTELTVVLDYYKDNPITVEWKLKDDQRRREIHESHSRTKENAWYNTATNG